MENRETYVKEMKSNIDKADAKIDELEAKARQAGADAEKKYHQIVADLRRKKELLEGRVEEISSASSESFDTLKNGAKEAWATFKTSVEDARANLN